MRLKAPTIDTRVTLLALLVAVVALPALAGAQIGPHLFAYSTLDALLAGVYDGELSVSALSAKGDFGLGTFNRLDGEMIMLEGICYHAKADGTVVIAGPGEKTPLAYVTQFRGTPSVPLESAQSLAELEKWLDGHLDNRNLFYAIRIDGLFRELSVRAIAPQSEPYKPLAEVVATQVVHDYRETRGVLVGIRSPAFSKGIGVPGYHWHYLTGDRKHGGHVLKLMVAEAGVQVMEIAALDLQLPGSDAFAKADQTKDRAEETRRVEGR